MAGGNKNYPWPCVNPENHFLYSFRVVLSLTCVVFSHTCTHLSLVNIEEKHYCTVGNSQKKYGYVSCLNIYLLLPGNIVLREITFSTTNTTMLKTAGVIHQSTDLFLCVEIIRWDPRKNFLLSTWRAFESGGCLKCFPCTNAWNKPKTEWPSWRLCLVEERKILQVISIRADESKLGNTCAIRSRVVGDQGQLFWESDF